MTPTQALSARTELELRRTINALHLFLRQLDELAAGFKGDIEAREHAAHAALNVSAAANHLVRLERHLDGLKAGKTQVDLLR